MVTRNLPVELSTLNLPASVAVGTIGNTAIRQFFWLKP
jgi:hypothetical protein